MLSMSTRLMEHMPKVSDLEDDIKQQEASAKKQEKFADKKGKDDDDGGIDEPAPQSGAPLVGEQVAGIGRCVGGRHQHSKWHRAPEDTVTAVS